MIVCKGYERYCVVGLGGRRSVVSTILEVRILGDNGKGGGGYSQE